MIVGAAQADITPDFEVELSGFAARTQPAVGVLNPLFVKALYVEDGPERLLWAHADVIAVDAQFVSDFRAWAHEFLNLRPDQVIFSATHTHSAPATTLGIGIQARLVARTRSVAAVDSAVAR